MALRLAEARVNLLLVARSGAALEGLAAELASRHGVEARALPLDLARPDAIAVVVEATRGLEVGLLVAAAGYGASGPLIEADAASEAAMVDVNCRALLLLAQHFGRVFAANRRGGMVLMSSLLAFQGVKLASNYAATKAYVQTLAEGLRLELAPFGVDVLACAPGPVLTGFAARADMRMAMGLTPRAVAQETLDALGRNGTVRPGWLSKLLELSLAPLPRRGRVRMMAVVMGGMAQGGKRGRTDAASGRPA
jgi:short-subunit dehydrogenase